MRRILVDRCPNITTKLAGDESLDFCDIVDKVCLLVGGYTCEEYEEIKKEWDNFHGA